MTRIFYLTAEEVIVLHEKLIDAFGGKPGLRDRGLLESALHRPQSGYYDNIFEQAAALLESLAMNHAFIDGNKRVAFTVTGVFLAMNGLDLKMAADDAERFLISDVIGKRCSVSESAEWLKAHARRRKKK